MKYFTTSQGSTFKQAESQTDATRAQHGMLGAAQPALLHEEY